MAGACGLSRWAFCLALCCLCSGCITVPVDKDGNEIKDPFEREKNLVIDKNGRILFKPSLILPPDRIIVNQDTPTERDLRLLGVEGLSERQAPQTLAECREWYFKYVASQSTIFVRPRPGTDTETYVIYGEVFVEAFTSDGKPITDGYVSINEALLSKGFVRIREINEFPDAATRERMKAREDEARREKRGLWGEVKE